MLKEVSFEIIQQCPNNCIQCSSSSNMESTNIIPYKKIIETIDALCSKGIKHISLSGGEPFLHKDLIKIVKSISAKKLTSSVYTSGVTVNVDGKVVPISFECLRDLLLSGLNRIIFDIPAVNEDIYDKIMGTTGHFNLMIQTLLNAKRANLPVEIHFVPMRINFHQIDAIIDFAIQNQIEKVSFLRLVPQGRGKDNYSFISLSTKQNQLLKDKLEFLSTQHDIVRTGTPLCKKIIRCHAGREKLCIKYDGTVHGCEAFKLFDLYDRGNTPVLADSIFDIDILNIITKSSYLYAERRFIDTHSEKQYHTHLENCPVQAYFNTRR